MSEEEFVAPYLLPHEIEDLIISYTQRNNEQVGYWEPKAHMPKQLSFLSEKKAKPSIGAIGFTRGGAWNTVYIPEVVFIVVRNEEWPNSLQVICPDVMLNEEKNLVTGYDLKNFEPLPNAPGGVRYTIDDYLYTVVELDKSTLFVIDWIERLPEQWQPKTFKYNRSEHRLAQQKKQWGFALNSADPGQCFDVLVRSTH